VSSIEGALANFFIFSTNVNVARIRAARKLDRSLKTNFKLTEGERKERASIETMSSINIVTGGRNLLQRFFSFLELCGSLNFKKKLARQACKITPAPHINLRQTFTP
jgi:hypothetical protein